MTETQTVARDGWSVSTTTGSGIEGAVLHVRKRRGDRMPGGDHDGRIFPSSDAAFAWAFEHGYTEVFRTAWCRHCRQAHTFLGRRSGFCQALGIFTSMPGLYDPKIGTLDKTAQPPYLTR